LKGSSVILAVIVVFQQLM